MPPLWHHHALRRMSSVALQKNSRQTLDIQTLSPEGQGIGTLNGRTIRVDRALPGERVEILLIKLAQRYAVGRLMRVIRPCADRVTPFCEVFARCGGCTLQHLDYQAQCRLKTDRLRNLMCHREVADAISVRETLGMAVPRRYRQKAQYPVVRHGDKIHMGFYARHSHEVIDHPACDIQPPVMTQIRDVIRQFLEAQQVSIYHETSHSGLVRYVIIRRAACPGECMVTLVLNGETLPHAETLIDMLTTITPAVTSIQISHNTRQTNRILGTTTQTLWGTPRITDTLGPYRFEMSPLSFYQVNPQQTRILYRTVQEYAGLHGQETVFDLFCGIGTIAISLARHAGYVYGIESVPQAIQDAERNAAINGITNVTFLTGAAENVLPDLIAQGIAADLVIVDPPRKGCDQALLNALIGCRTPRIVYVSCYPKTLIRDIAYLAQHGFRCLEIQPIDMFPHTMHVECVANIINETTGNR